MAETTRQGRRGRDLAAGVMLAVIAGYRRFGSPLLGGHCRFEPSCSCYARDAIRLHGPWRGGSLALRRVCRCRPGGGAGFDPVPQGKPADPEIQD
ncbi:MAG: membrane protein insertion efficiency factor YidD [Planctomycetaceae bacterium]|nr:membrane protein insertion efficiency factor YidD [Planctomycetaceae bacterium]